MKLAKANEKCETKSKIRKYNEGTQENEELSTRGKGKGMSNRHKQTESYE